MACIAQWYSTSFSSSSLKTNTSYRTSQYISSSTLSTPYRTAYATRTSTRNSVYTSSTTLRTNSSTKLSTRTATRSSGSYKTTRTTSSIYQEFRGTKVTFGERNSYYTTSTTKFTGAGSVIFSGTNSTKLNAYKTITSTNTGNSFMYIYMSNSLITFLSNNTFNITTYAGSTQIERMTNSHTTSNKSILYGIKAGASSYKTASYSQSVTEQKTTLYPYPYLYKITTYKTLTRSASANTTYSSRASTYTSSSTLSTASRTQLQTNTAYRTSLYTATTGTYTTQSSSQISTRTASRTSQYVVSSTITSSASTLTNNCNV